MAVDYDVRQGDSDQAARDLEEQAASGGARTAQQPEVEPDEAEVAETFELPGADLSDESLSVRVDPKQADEFTCTGCFLVRHHAQLAVADSMLCRDCA